MKQYKNLPKDQKENLNIWIVWFFNVTRKYPNFWYYRLNF